MPRMYLPTIMRKATEGSSTVSVEGSTVEQVLEGLVTSYPDLRSHLFSDKGDLLRHVLVILNGEDIRSLDGVRTTVSDRDELQLLPAMAGG